MSKFLGILKFIGCVFVSTFIFLSVCFGFTILIFRGANIIAWIVGASVFVLILAAIMWWVDGFTD